jgi:hypothetical protein
VELYPESSHSISAVVVFVLGSSQMERHGDSEVTCKASMEGREKAARRRKDARREN